MKKFALAFIFFCLTARLFAQPFDGGANFPPTRRDGGRSNRGLRPNRQAEQTEKKIDSRSPASKLEMLRPTYHHIQQPNAKEEKKSDQAPASDTMNPAANAKPVLLPSPVSGPGNPLAPAPTVGKYPPMPAGKKIFECSHCHYIYYTNYMPDIVKCEKPGLVHDWHLIGLKGTIWYRCINCNTHVCCSKTPLRSHCNLESKHIWEVVGQLSNEQQKKELEEELD